MVTLKDMGKGIGRGTKTATLAVVEADLAAPVKCVNNKVRSVRELRQAMKAARKLNERFGTDVTPEALQGFEKSLRLLKNAKAS